MPVQLDRRTVLRGVLGSALLGMWPRRARAEAAPDCGDAGWSNWSGWVCSNPAARAAPGDEGALVELLRAGRGPLRAVGAGHSFSPLVATDGTLVSLDGLSGVAEPPDANGRVTLYAGTRLFAVGHLLHAAGRALDNLPDVDQQSLAGALATATHGTGIGLPCLSAALTGLRLVTADGTLVDCDAERESDVFEAARVSLGALGVASRMRLRTLPTYRLREHQYVAPLEQVLAQAETLRTSHRHFEFWIFPYAEHALVKVLDPTDDPPTPPESSGFDDNLALAWALRITDALPFLAAPLQRQVVPWLGETERVGDWHRIFPTPRSVRFNEMEYQVPAERGPECLAEVLDVVRRRELPVVFPLEFRYVAADDLWLSPFHGRASASISVHRYAEHDPAPLFEAVEPVFWRHQGRPHWGKLHSLDHARLREHYPRLDDFRRVRAALDPEGRFLNPHLRALLGA